MSGPETIREQALQLPRRERAGLARELIASLDGAADADVDQAWLEEVARRGRDVAEGGVQLEDWADVRERVAAKLRGMRT